MDFAIKEATSERVILCRGAERWVYLLSGARLFLTSVSARGREVPITRGDKARMQRRARAAWAQAVNDEIATFKR